MKNKLFTYLTIGFVALLLIEANRQRSLSTNISNTTLENIEALVYAVMIGSKDPNANSIITTWDWNGNPIGHYRTKRHYLQNLC